MGIGPLLLRVIWSFRKLGSPMRVLLTFRIFWVYSRSLKVGNPVASILKRNIPLFGLHPVSNFMGFTVGCWRLGFMVLSKYSH